MDQIDINRLWQNFVDTITNHYADFEGRVSRARYWYYILVVVAIGVLVAIIASVTTHLVSTLYSLAVIIPNLAMTVRRLHDTNKPGIWVLLGLVPAVIFILFGLLAVLGGVLGFLLFLFAFVYVLWLVSLVAIGILIYLCAQPGTSGPNQYGPEPVDSLAAAAA